MKFLPLLKLLGLVVLFSQCAGCCCLHKKGITLRGGLDFREYKKPSGFIELVDTGWDERRRRHDLKWLENADCHEEYPVSLPSADSELGEAQPGPDADLPILNELPESELPESDLPPLPENVPPIPPPEPEKIPHTQEESALLPSPYDDREDYQQMIELTGHEQPVRSVANRPSAVNRLQPQKKRLRPPGNWLWAKP